MATTLRLHDLDSREREALGQLLTNFQPNDELAQLKQYLAQLKEKLLTYMLRENHQCVSYQDRFLRIQNTNSPKKLTLQCLMDAIDSISEADISEKQAALKRKKNSDCSLSAIVMNLVFLHIRNNHYSHRQALQLDKRCPRNVVPHTPSEKTQVIIKEWSRVKDQIAQLKSQRQAVTAGQQELTGFFDRTNQTEAQIKVHGQPMKLRKAVRTYTKPPPITAVKTRFVSMIQPYQSLSQLKQAKYELAERLLDWIEREKEASREVKEQVFLKAE